MVDEVADKASKYKKEAYEFAEGAREKAEEVVEEVKENVADLKSRTEKAVDGAKKGFFSKK